MFTTIPMLSNCGGENLNYIVSIINPDGEKVIESICNEFECPVMLSMHGHGTATRSMLDLLGIESRDKRIIMVVANEEDTKAYIKEQKKRLYIDAPGNGITIIVPLKSVGGGKTLAYLGKGQVKSEKPDFNFDYELIMVIANEGTTDIVMDAARAVGARGGTVIHAKGTGADNAGKFFRVSIAQEKEIVLIVAKAGEKTKIMSSVLEQAGPDSEAGAIVFSMPVSEVAGFRVNEE